MNKKAKEEVLRKTFKAKVVLDEESTSLLEEVSSNMVALWNLAHDQITAWLSENKDKLKEERKVINAFALNYWLTPIRQSNSEINRVSSDICQQVCKLLVGAFDSFWALKSKNDPKARWPKKKGSEEKPFQGFQTLGFQTAKISPDSTQIFLPTLDKKRITVDLPGYLQRSIHGKQVKYVTLYKTEGEFWISVVCSSKLPNLRTEGIIRVLDFGAGNLALSDSDGSEFSIPARREDKWVREQVRKIENRGRLRMKGSRGHKRLMSARRGMFGGSQNQHIDHQKKVADAVCEQKVRCLVIGKPKTRIGLAQAGTADQSWGVQNTGYMARLMSFIKNKAKERGIQVIEVEDPRRKGQLDDPDSKFNATRDMLSVHLATLGLEMPKSFVKRGFKFSM
jgi:transposase